jgi:hypothetical protein
MIIRNAVSIISPKAYHGEQLSEGNEQMDVCSGEYAAFAPILTLEPFDRFVFVLSVLERYSDHECTVLLNSARRDVAAARTRALHCIAPAAEERHYASQQSFQASRETD